MKVRKWRTTPFSMRTHLECVPGMQAKALPFMPSNAPRSCVSSPRITSGSFALRCARTGMMRTSRAVPGR